MAKKTVSKEPIKLAPIKVKSITKPTKKGEIPTIMVEGNCAEQYNEYHAIEEDAKGQQKELKRVMTPEAITELFKRNSEKPWEAISSVKLQDETDSVTRITFMAKYSDVQPVVVEALFNVIKTVKGEKPNVNDYFCRTMVGEFNNDVFLNAEGRFDQKRYDAIMKALADVCREEGIQATPLATKEVVRPLPDFHNRRWMDFGPKTNEQITAVVPNQINFYSCPKAGDASEEGNGK